jgi:hypothetical protein
MFSIQFSLNAMGSYRLIFLFFLMSFVAKAQTTLENTATARYSTSTGDRGSFVVNDALIKAAGNTGIGLTIGSLSNHAVNFMHFGVQRIGLSASGIAFTGGLTWNSSILDNASTNALVLGGTGALGYRPLSSVAFTGSYASLTGTPLNNLSNTTATGNNTPYSIVMDGYGDHGLYGTYDPTKIRTVYGMGAAFTLPLNGTYASGTNANNFYGLAISYDPDYGTVGTNSQAKAGLGHQFLFMQNGQTGTAIGEGIWTRGNITGTASLNLSGTARILGNVDIDGYNGSGHRFSLSNLNRMFMRYGGDESTLSGSGLEWFSYDNTGAYFSKIMNLSRNGDLYNLGSHKSNNHISLSAGSETYSATLGSGSLQLGSNGANWIVAGKSTAGGSLSLYVNNTNTPVLGTTAPNGINVANYYNDGVIQMGYGSANGLTNKFRLYNAGGTLENETDNSYGFGANHSTGRFSMSAGITGFIDFSTNNLARMRVENSGDVTINNSLKVSNVINSSNVIRSFSNSTLGYASMIVGNTTNAGYIEIFRPNLQRSLYLGYATATGPNSYVAENGAWHAFSGGKVQIFNNVEAYKGIFSDNVKTSLQYQGGFGAMNTTGVADWSDITNTVSGNGYTLLLGTATNGNGIGAYYHPFNFEYSSKDGTGNICQIAIPYNGSDMWLRGRYSGAYTPWKTYIQSSKIQDVGNNDVVHSGNVANYNNNASNLTTGTLTDVRLSINVPLKTSANDYQGTNRFYGTTLLDGPILLSTPNQSPIIAAHKVMMQDASNQPNRVTQSELSSAFTNLTQQAYQAVLIENGSYSIPNDAGYVVMSRSGTLTNTGIYTINLPTTPNSNTQEIEFSLPFLHAMIGFQLQFKQAATLVRTISFGTSAQTGNNYAIYAPSNASFKIRYNSLTNQWYIVNIYNPN